MKLYKKASIIVASLLLLAILGGFIIVANPPYWLLNAVAVYKIKHLRLTLEDGLHAVLTGTGSPLADIKRAGPSVAIQAGNKLFIVDTGDGSARNLQGSGLNIGRVDAVFITHFHSDHIGGLGETMLQRWAAGKAIEFDLGPDPLAGKIIYDREGVKITAFNVNHAPVYPAVGYKFEYKGRNIVISGDTVYTENLVEQSKGVDVLICDALNQELVKIINQHANLIGSSTVEKITEDIQTYHITPEQAAQVAAKADVRYLTLTHIIPPLPSTLLHKVFLGGSKKIYKGKIDIGRDGMLISLPANSKSIKTKYLFG